MHDNAGVPVPGLWNCPYLHFINLQGNFLRARNTLNFGAQRYSINTYREKVVKSNQNNRSVIYQNARSMSAST